MPRRRRSPKKPAAQVRLDPNALAKAIRRRNWVAALGVVALLVVIATQDQWLDVLPVDDDWHKYHGQAFEVARVVDGDTIDLRVADGDKATTRVRLWGVDTPELAKGKAKPAEPWAEAAADYTRQRVTGRQVVVSLQSQRPRGRYGRLLVYLELPDGGVLNDELIAQGLSPHDGRWGHDRAEAYDALQREARRSGRGLWSN